jgi:hypothetical protein
MISGCKKDSGDVARPTPQPTPATGTFEMHLHTYIGKNKVIAPYEINRGFDGLRIFLTTADVYLGHIQLIRPDGSAVDFPGKIILKDLLSESFVLGKVEAGDYKSIRFNVGLDPATNKFNLSQSADSSLLNNPKMWFDTGAHPAGHIFLRASGSVDTPYDDLMPFDYAIGTDANYVQVTMPENSFSVLADQVTLRHIVIDYSQLFNGIDRGEFSNLFMDTPQTNSSNFGKQVTGNIPSMFRYEE